MSQLRLPIAGMTCQGCAAAAARAIRSVPGVAEVRVTLTPGAADITIADAADAATAGRIADAVRKAGFTPG
jgi:copper chaperone CopZ